MIVDKKTRSEHWEITSMVPFLMYIMVSWMTSKRFMKISEYLSYSHFFLIKIENNQRLTRESYILSRKILTIRR